MPSRKSVAGGVESLDFAAADEAVGQLVEVVGGEHDDHLGRQLFETVQPHHLGLRGHAVGFVDDDDFPAAAAAIGHRCMRRNRSSTARRMGNAIEGDRPSGIMSQKEIAICDTAKS